MCSIKAGVYVRTKHRRWVVLKGIHAGRPVLVYMYKQKKSIITKLKEVWYVSV